MGGQTLAIIIKEMQVRDGGGEVVVFFFLSGTRLCLASAKESCKHGFQ